MSLLEKLRNLYDVDWAALDSREAGLELAADLVAEDFEYQFSPEVSDRTLYGLGDISNFMMAVEEDFREYRQKILGLFGNDERIVVTGVTEGRGRLSGLPVRTPFAHVWTVEEGIAVRLQAFPSADEALAAAAIDVRID